ncbi:MAG: adenylyltransferase/cytidyltransferase family protein [Candidatus Poseidoniaceae archaeon]|jgi:cytidyltransferase-like protein|nr:adenylyltransferase/cytidyltransferase family protein [Candidatus Poseidoniaceae archaeon]
MYIVLGRFQPFHKGHEYLIEKALDLGEVTIAIGSGQESWTLENPWSAEERESMIIAWLGDRHANIVQIDDINDPPNWVEHARKIHGSGTLVTSDVNTFELYSDSKFPVEFVELENRENLEGWRVRTTLKMLSTIGDLDAQRAIMQESIPDKVVDWLLDNDAIHRLYSISKGIEHAG